MTYAERFCCDGKCEQGRFCPALHPDEEDAEVGQDEDITRFQKAIDLLLGLLLAASISLVVLSLIK